MSCLLTNKRHFSDLVRYAQEPLYDLRFRGGDYEECRLLGYKNPVRTSQETHYVSATESSQLMLCKI
jgi:hypothetical protein